MSKPLTQAELEMRVRDALIERTDDDIDWERISDAVDVHLGRLERARGHVLDRGKIDADTVGEIINHIVNE